MRRTLRIDRPAESSQSPHVHFILESAMANAREYVSEFVDRYSCSGSVRRTSADPGPSTVKIAAAPPYIYIHTYVVRLASPRSERERTPTQRQRGRRHKYVCLEANERALARGNTRRMKRSVLIIHSRDGMELFPYEAKYVEPSHTRRMRVLRFRLIQPFRDCLT